MPIEDAQRWDQRYSSDKRFEEKGGPHPFLVENAYYLPTRGLGLDVAMGLGNDSAFLIQRGLRMIGVDISGVAVRRAKAAHPELMAVQADLTRCYLPPERFDVILNFFYLQRDLWPRYVRSLRPGGLLILETLLVDIREMRPDIDPQYLLQPGELAGAFPDLETLTYKEGWSEGAHGHPRPVASLCARKP